MLCLIHFPCCEKFSLLLLVPFLKVYFIVKAAFLSVYWGKRKQFSPPRLPQGPSVETSHSQRVRPAPAPLHSSSREGRQRAGTGNKVKTRRKTNRRKRAGSKSDDLARYTAIWDSAQSEASCEEMPESKDVPAAPAAWHLPGIPAAISLNKQIPGTDKENEVQGQWRVKEDKRIKGKMLE